MTPDERHQADRLGAYADRWLDGHIDEPTTTEEATFAHLQRVLGTTSSASTTQSIVHQENPMLPIASIQSPPMPPSPRHRSPVRTALSRWQPVFSLAVMFAILAGLVGVAYTGLNRQANGPEPTMFAALSDDATPASEACTPPPPSASDEDLLNASLTDWPAPVYFATDYADDDTADQVREAFTAYLRCADALGYFTADTDLWSPEIWASLSPRARYLGLYEALTPDQQASIDIFSCRSREADVLANFPILVNNKYLPVPMSADRYTIYDDQDVYLLDDGRYAIGTGTITSASLRNPAEPAIRDAFGIVTLVEQDGHFYIDEYFIALSGDPSLYSYGQMRGDCD
jgi:hypothetical protein